MAVGKSKTVLGANATLEAYFFAAVEIFIWQIRDESFILPTQACRRRSRSPHNWKQAHKW